MAFFPKHLTTEIQLAGPSKWAELFDRVESFGFDHVSIGTLIGH
jgi:hypothetical protein